jgi:hypothetical protein
MIDWEDLATRQINKIPRALPSQSGLVQRRSRCFSARQGTNWDITLGGMKDRLQMSAWREVSSGREEPRQPNHRFWDAPLRESFKIRHRIHQIAKTKKSQVTSPRSTPPK